MAKWWYNETKGRWGKTKQSMSTCIKALDHYELRKKEKKKVDNFCTRSPTVIHKRHRSILLPLTRLKNKETLSFSDSVEHNSVRSNYSFLRQSKRESPSLTQTWSKGPDSDTLFISVDFWSTNTEPILAFYSESLIASKQHKFYLEAFQKREKVFF